MSSPTAPRLGDRPRVLVIFPGALGDLVCLVPAIRALARRHAGASLELMAKGELAEFAVGRIPVERGHSIDRREVSMLFAEQPRCDLQPFFARFARIYSFFGYDRDLWRHNLAATCPGVVSFHRFRPETAGRDACPTQGGEGHVAGAYLREIGEEAGELNSEISLLPEDLEAARAMLAAFDLAPGKFVLLMPGSGSPAKNWPAERFAELARRIAGPVAVLLGPAESELKPCFAGRGLKVLEGLGLGAAAALARMASAFVGNDSGISHLAAAAGAPGVVLFGPTDPGRWRPLGPFQLVGSDSCVSPENTRIPVGTRNSLPKRVGTALGAVRVLRRSPLSDLSVEEVMAELGRLESQQSHRGTSGVRT